MMEPVRECQRAKFFRRDQFAKWHPCLENDEGAVKQTIFEIEGDMLAVPAVKLSHFENVRLHRLALLARRKNASG